MKHYLLAVGQLETSNVEGRSLVFAQWPGMFAPVLGKEEISELAPTTKTYSMSVNSYHPIGAYMRQRYIELA